MNAVKQKFRKARAAVGSRIRAPGVDHGADEFGRDRIGCYIDRLSASITVKMELRISDSRRCPSGRVIPCVGKKTMT